MQISIFKLMLAGDFTAIVRRISGKKDEKLAIREATYLICAAKAGFDER